MLSSCSTVPRKKMSPCKRCRRGKNDLQARSSPPDFCWGKQQVGRKLGGLSPPSCLQPLAIGNFWNFWSVMFRQTQPLDSSPPDSSSFCRCRRAKLRIGPELSKNLEQNDSTALIDSAAITSLWSDEMGNTRGEGRGAGPEALAQASSRPKSKHCAAKDGEN